MAIYGKAKWRPLGPQTQGRMKSHDIICLHTMVGSLYGTDASFRRDGYGGLESHFGVGPDGEILQWQDTDYTADANLNGNWHLISIETADSGLGFLPWTGSNVPPWREAQIQAIAGIVAWCCKTHNIPCVLIPDSLPSRRGIGYHRLGIDPYRIHGGELWSSARGKACPGDRRIAQVPAIISKASLIVGTREEIEVVTDQDIVKIAEAVKRAQAVTDQDIVKIAEAVKWTQVAFRPVENRNLWDWDVQTSWDIADLAAQVRALTEIVKVLAAAAPPSQP